MLHGTRVILAACVLAGLGAALPAQAKEQTVTLTIGEARLLAANANAAGQYGLALGITEGLLKRDARDYLALMQTASADIGLGRYGAAATAARQAFHAARNRAERANAARIAASAQFRAKHFSRAEIWLRRAFNAADDGALKNVLRREFALVRQENPLSVTLNFSIAPNNNINNGSSSKTITIWNLPFVLSPDARALSGTEAALSIGVKYRISQSQVQQTHLGFTLYGRTYRFSAASRAAAPTKKGSDYAFAMAELSLTQNRRFAAMSAPTSFSLVAGQYWYGGKPYIAYARAGIAQGFSLSDRTGANLRLGYEVQSLKTSGGSLSRLLTLGGGINHALANNDRVSLDVQLSRTNSQDVTARNTATRLQLSYSFAKPIWGTQLSLNLSAEKRDYAKSIYDISGRHDLTVTAGANLLFSNVSYYGFSPSLSLETSRTNSNISLFRRESTAVRLGVQSTF